MPRSIMADIIYRNEDDLIKRRHRAAALIELPSGAWQKRPTATAGGNITAEHAVPTAAAESLGSRMVVGAGGLRQRRGGRGAEPERNAPHHTDQPEVNIFVFNF